MLKSSFSPRTILHYVSSSSRTKTLRKICNWRGFKLESILTPFRNKFAITQLERRRGFLVSAWQKLNYQILSSRTSLNFLILINSFYRSHTPQVQNYAAKHRLRTRKISGKISVKTFNTPWWWIANDPKLSEWSLIVF